MRNLGNPALTYMPGRKCEPLNRRSRIRLDHIFWMFIIGSLAGFFIETIWCAIRYGQYQWRSAIVFLPLNVVYGIGAIALHLMLSYVDQTKKWQIFMCGVIGGSIVEYGVSFVQEALFHTVSWDYSAVPFNIGGRVCLLFSVFWGLLALAWVWFIYPGIMRILHRIPERAYRPLTIGVIVIFAIAGLLSCLAVLRWGIRLDGLPPANTVERVLDRVFHNELMTFFYCSMTFL